MFNAYLSIPGLTWTNAHTITTGVWVDYVREGGEWDYKLKNGFKGRLFDSTTSSNPVLITGGFTGEYFGNFNYGYTGRFLFALSILYTGSAVVAGGWKKGAHDRPAIKAGYDAAGVYR